METKTAKQGKSNLRATLQKQKVMPAPGKHTLAEIFSQPETWRETARRLAQKGMLTELKRTFSARKPWLFVACGSSYYLSQLVVTLWGKMLGVPCTAIPASEFLLAPEDTLAQTGAQQAVLVSRSGETTEVLRVAEFFKARPEIRTLGVTCSAKSSLENLCANTLKLTWADERSTVMTRSFTSMLMVLELLAAELTGDTALASALDCLPEKVEPWLAANAPQIQAFGSKRSFEDFVFLGQGAHYWLAQEAALKVTEMSSSYAQAYHTLEFRHGPRAITSRETLITFLISEEVAEEEGLLVLELKELGAAIMIVVNRGTQKLKNSSDLFIELGLDAPEWGRLAAMAIPAQLLGAATGIRKGLNPDFPRNLSRVVTLASRNSLLAKRRRA